MNINKEVEKDMSKKASRIEALIKLHQCLSGPVSANSKKVTLEQVGKSAGLSSEEYWFVEKGKLVPDRYHLDDIAKFYGVDGSIFDNVIL